MLTSAFIQVLMKHCVQYFQYPKKNTTQYLQKVPIPLICIHFHNSMHNIIFKYPLHQIVKDLEILINIQKIYIYFINYQSLKFYKKNMIKKKKYKEKNCPLPKNWFIVIPRNSKSLQNEYMLK